MFALPNPKKSLTIEFPIAEIMSAIPKIRFVSGSKYRVTDTNTLFNQVTLEATEFLSLGIYIDFSLVSKGDSTTEITIEIRRKIGSFDHDYEIQKANYHFVDLMKALTTSIGLSPSEFAITYAKEIAAADSNDAVASSPWYLRPYIAGLITLLGFLTIPVLIGVVILPIGVWGLLKKRNSNISS